MPECPELNLSSIFINTRCAGLHFGGAVEKSAVSKNAEVPFRCPDYTVSSVSRGKELKVILTPVSSKYKAAHIVFRFGMSGSFTVTPEDKIPKHAHLRFYTKDAPRQVLCFVDPRRFGSWEVNGLWQQERGPCVLQEYDKFRENILKNLSDKAFDKPICEALLNQKFFNGIGNYLRSEILFRLQVPPFMPARAVLEAVMYQNQSNDAPLRKKVKLKEETPDLLQLCHLVPKEVVSLGEKGYSPGQSNDYSLLLSWARCYFVPGMKSMKDHSGRKVWFQGDPGPLAPKGAKAEKYQGPAKVRKNASKHKVVMKQEKVEHAENKLESNGELKTRKKTEDSKRKKKETPQRGKSTRHGAAKESTSKRGLSVKIPSRLHKDRATLRMPKGPSVKKKKRLDGDTATPTRNSQRLRTLRKIAGRGGD